MEEILYLEKPDLHKPYLIIGFEGWPNAAEVSSFALQYLQAKNVRVAYAVLKSLIHLTRTEMDLSELEKASDYFDQQIDHLVEQDPKLQEAIRKLVEIYKQSDRFSPLSSREEGFKEDKVIYIQAFLKKQGEDEKKED